MIGEELGFVGVCVVIVAFFWLTRRIFVIGRQAVALDRVFAGLMVQGIGIWIGGQAFINMGVNLGVLPTKGLTLPLMSYGGSAILMNLIALAIVLRVDIENRTHARRPRMTHASMARRAASVAIRRRLISRSDVKPRSAAGAKRLMRGGRVSHLVIMARHRRAHHPRPRRGARDAAPRLERQLAGHARTAWRTGSCRPTQASRWTRIGFSRPARQGPAAHADRRPAPAARPSGTACASCAGAAPMPCSAWAAMSASRAG